MKTRFPTWNSLLLPLQIIAAALCGYFVLYSITDADIFWHLASGREMLARKAFLYTDPFLYTIPAGTPWVNLHWLFQIVMYAVVSFGGLSALLAVKVATVSAAAWCLFSLFPRTKKTVFGAFVFALAVYGQRYLVPLRPGIVTLLFAGGMILTLEHWRNTRKFRFAVVAAIVQIAWVNCQGLFLIGPAIAGAYAFGEIVQRFLHRKAGPVNPGGSGVWVILALPGVLALLSLVNPYGVGAFDLAGKLFSRIVPVQSNLYSSSIAENAPLLSMVGTSFSGYADIIGAGVVVLAALAAKNLRNVRVELLVLAIMGTGLAFMARRNGILFTVFALPLFLHLLSITKTPAGRTVKLAALFAVLLTAAGVFAAGVRHTRMLISWPHELSPFSYPVKSAAYLHGHSSPGNLFNADRYGGYLSWKLYPGCKASSDTRLVLRNEAWFREYLSMVHDPALFDDYAVKWDITRVVLPLAPIKLYLPLAGYLYRNPDWNLVQCDGAEALFVLKKHQGEETSLQLDSRVTVDSIAKDLQKRYAGSPAVFNEASLSLVWFCMSTGSLQGAGTVLPFIAGADRYLLEASLHLQRGYYAEAESVLVAGVNGNPRNSIFRMHLVSFYLSNGHADKALEQLELLLKKDPFNRKARNVLFTLKKQTKEHHE